MKLVILMYLEEDERCVQSLLRERDVSVFSRLSIEGVGPGTPAWYGEPAPYESRMTFTIVEEEQAADLLAAVRGARGCLDAAHPVRAIQLAIEETAACGSLDEEEENR